MRGVRIARVIVALMAVAALLLWTSTGPSPGQPDLALPALVFCFLVVFSPSLRRLPGNRFAAQSISLLSLHISRAPPLA